MQKRSEFKMYNCTFSRIQNKAHGCLQCLRAISHYRIFIQAFAKVNNINNITRQHEDMTIIFEW